MTLKELDKFLKNFDKRSNKILERIDALDDDKDYKLKYYRKLIMDIIDLELDLNNALIDLEKKGVR